MMAIAPLVGGDLRVVRLVINTWWLAGLVCLLAVPTGSLLAFLCLRSDMPGGRTLVLVVGLVLFVPLYLHAAAWQSGFGWDGWYTVLTGNVYRPATSIGGEGPAVRPPISTGTLVAGWRGAVIVHAIYAIPWVVLIVGLGLVRIEAELEEYALLDTNPWGVFRHVTVWRGAPALVIATLWVAISTSAEMTVTDLFQVRTYAEELYTDLTLGTPAGETAVQALPGVVAAAWLVAVGCLVAARLAPHAANASLGQRIVFPLGRLRWPLMAVSTLATMLVAGVPLFSLAYKAGSKVSVVGGARVRDWSFEKLLALVVEAPARFGRELYWSLLLAGLVATAAVTTGWALAWTARRGGWRAAVVLILCGFAVAIPGPLLGLALIRLLNQPESWWLAALYDRTLLAPWLALCVRSTPWATLILWHALRNVSQETLEAAELDGAGAWRRLWQVALPQCRSAVALAWLVAGIIALGDLSATILVLPPGVMTISSRIFERLHYGAEDQVAGVCLLLVAVFASLGLLLRRMVMRIERERIKQRPS